MPISKKTFSKKRVKKSVRKNTKKHKKRTFHRKHRKSSKRVRFFGGDGEDGEECSICLLPLTDNTNGEIYETNCKHNFHRGCIERSCRQQARREQICTCPLCRTELNPVPKPNRRRGTPVEFPRHMYRIEFFRTDEENNRVPVRIQDLSPIDMVDVGNYLVTDFDGGLSFANLRIGLTAQRGNTPYGYIVLDNNANNVGFREGDIDLENTTNISSIRITPM
jgi:hypothetical protein